MKWSGEYPMPVIGRGSEATVYFDEQEGRVVKHFDRAPVRIARRKAQKEFERLQKAHALTGTSDTVRVPEPGELRGQRAAFSMGRVVGSSLLDQLAWGHIRGQQTREMAARVAEGIRLFKDLMADCTLDHIHPNPDGTVTFLDFGNGSEDENGIEAGSILTAFIEVGGSTLYECSRIARYRGQAELDECARFIGYLAIELGLTWNYGLERKIWHSFAGRGLEGSLFRFFWYRLTGGHNSKRMFCVIRRMMPARSLPRLDTVFSFVWDFPTDDLELTNGVHKVVDGMMSSLARNGVDPVLLTLGRDHRVLHRIGYTIEVHPVTGRRLPSSLKERIATEGLSSVTLLHGTFNTWNTRLGYHLQQQGLPYAVQPHTIMDAAFFEVSALRKRIYWTLFERRFLNGARLIFSYARDEAQRLAERGVHTPVAVTMNGLCSTVRPSEDVYSTDGPVRFHFFGRISTRTKGLDLLLEATARVAADTPVEVTIQGPDNGDLDGLKAHASKLGLTDAIAFKGPAHDPDPVVIMAGYDVCILPSRYEGFPTAAVEALVAARPLVCTRAGALASRLEEEGLAIVVDSSVEAIEQGMREAIERRSEWPEMGRKARSWALTHLEWDPIVSDMLHQLAQVVPTA